MAVDGAAGDELHQLQPLAELADHRVHPAGEVADLVAGAHALDAGGEVALPYPLGHGADLQDRAGEAAGEEERGGGGDAEAGEADEEEVAQHVVDDGVGVRLGELGDDRPGEGVGEGVGAEHGLAVGADVALDRLGAGGGDDERRGGGDDGAVGEGPRLELEDGAAVGVDHRDLAAPGEGVVAHQPAERREVDRGRRSMTLRPASLVCERQRDGGEPVAGGLEPAGHELAVAAVAADGVDLGGGGARACRPGRGRRRRGAGRRPGR